MSETKVGICCRTLVWLIGGWLLWLASGANAQPSLPETITHLKKSVVVVGTYNKLRNPSFEMRGTGFAVGDGHMIATNAHVVPDTLNAATNETLVALLPGSGEPQPRELQLVTKDVIHDVALLRLAGAPLPPVKLRNPEDVPEGQSVAFMGFPIGGALGFSPVTHRGTISAISPISLPGSSAQFLNEKMIRQLRHGTFNIFQLDATAYPGNSGSPMFDPDTGDVLGLINMVFIKTTREASLSQPSGISYAIPSNFLLDLLAIQQQKH